MIIPLVFYLEGPDSPRDFVGRDGRRTHFPHRINGPVFLKHSTRRLQKKLGGFARRWLQRKMQNNQSSAAVNMSAQRGKMAIRHVVLEPIGINDQDLSFAQRLSRGP